MLERPAVHILSRSRARVKDTGRCRVLTTSSVAQAVLRTRTPKIGVCIIRELVLQPSVASSPLLQALTGRETNPDGRSALI